MPKVKLTILERDMGVLEKLLSNTPGISKYQMTIGELDHGAVIEAPIVQLMYFASSWAQSATGFSYLQEVH